jgi:diacylglycerol kinase (ATP)
MAGLREAGRLVKPVLVVNPCSGGGRTGKVFGEMRAAIARALGEVEVLTTERAGHAMDLAREAADAGAPLVVAVGGDGTLHEVVNGVMRAAKREARVGLIAQGTGGDFRKTLGLEHRLDAYLDALASGTERPIDVAQLTYTRADGERATRYFVNIYSAGMGGLVDLFVAQGSKALGGKAAYYVASVKALLRAARARVRCVVTSEGKTEERVVSTYMLAVCNGRYFGGGMHVAPMAQLDDGKLEIVAMDAPSKLAFAMRSNSIYAGEHLRAPTTTHFSCEKVELHLTNADDTGVFLNDVDGEPLGGLPATVEIVPKAIVLRG